MDLELFKILVDDLENYPNYENVKTCSINRKRKTYSKKKEAESEQKQNKFQTKIIGEEICGSGARKYSNFNETELYSTIQQKKIKNEEFFYHEILNNRTPVRFFFDIDLKTKHLVDFEKTCLFAMCLFKKFMKIFFSVEVNIEKDATFIFGTRKEKYSAHIILSGEYICLDLETLKYIMKMFNFWTLCECKKGYPFTAPKKPKDEISEYFDNPTKIFLKDDESELLKFVNLFWVEENELVSIIDDLVYVNGSLRMCESSKWKSDKTMDISSKLHLYTLTGLEFKKTTIKSFKDFSKTLIQPTKVKESVKMVKITDSKMVIDEKNLDLSDKIMRGAIEGLIAEYDEIRDLFKSEEKKYKQISALIVELICAQEKPAQRFSKKGRKKRVREFRNLPKLTNQMIKELTLNIQKKYDETARNVYKVNGVKMTQKIYFEFKKVENNLLIFGVRNSLCLCKMKKTKGMTTHKKTENGENKSIFCTYSRENGVIIQKCFSRSCQDSYTFIGIFNPEICEIKKKKPKLSPHKKKQPQNKISK